MSTQNKNSPTEQTKNKRYIFAHREGDEYTCIKITEGKFIGVIYHYGKVSFAPESEMKEGKLPMKFDYTVALNPTEYNLNDNQEFIDFIGDILLELLEEQVKSGKAIT